MTSYAYIHCKPDGTPFYVGKGAMRRAKYLGERNPHHKAVVSKYGKQSILKGWLECSDDSIALELEVGLIKCLRRMGVHLTNFTDGGEGTKNPAPETRQKLSEAAKLRGVSEACHTARNKARKGVSLSADHKAKVSAGMKGKEFTEEHRKNISISATKRGMSAQVITAAKKANLGRVMPADIREKHRAAMLAMWDKKGRKEKPSKGPKGTCWDTRETRVVYVDGIQYKSMKLAASAIGVTSSAIIYALKHSGVVKGHTVTESINDD